MQTKKLITFCASIIMIALFSHCAIHAQGSLVRDSLYGSSLENNLLGDPVTRYLQIYLPPGYETTAENYPVVYLLHTGTASECFYPYNEFPAVFESFGMFTKPQDFPESGFAVMIDSLILTGKIKPLIIVMPNINTTYGGSFCVNSALNGNYEDYIINDIVPHVDAHYRTLENRNSRAIAGHCMGGYGAIHLAMKHPDVFGAVAGFSADLCIETLVRAFQSYVAMENPGGITGPDPSKPFISFLYLFSAAFSPNLMNPPYYVDLPLDDTCGIREDVVTKWAEYDPIQVFPDHRIDLQSLKGIYFDAGNMDELQSSYFMTPFIDSLNAAGISNSFEIYEGTHFSKLFTRLKSSLEYLSGVLEHNGENPTDIPAGDVSGTWTYENSPYVINGEIMIPDGETLTIEPGVQVVFTGHYKFNVQGRLLAVGTARDTIYFTARDASIGWHGIRFRDTPNTNDSSKMVFCSLKYGKANTGDDYDKCGGALLVKGFNKLLVSNCLFSYNMNTGNLSVHAGGAIGILGCSPLFENNTISYNKAVGNHGGGICIAFNANPVLRNNLICKNQAAGGAALFIYQSTPVFINNTIVFNHADLPGTEVCHGGAACIISSSPKFINTIIFGNSATVGNQFNLQSGSQPGFHFCDIEGGKESFSRDFVSGGSFSGVYAYNIESDPLFLDTASDDFRLSENSPCISHGADSLEVNATCYYASGFDMNGNPRPNPVNTTPDIGAIENSKGYSNPQTGLFEAPNPDASTIQLFQNYPNPFSTVTEIPFSLSACSWIKLQVYDFLGRLTEVLADEEMLPGVHRVSFGAKDLPGGVYYCMIIINNESIETRKMILKK